ncbi:MAG: hypothetical protein LBR08_02680 [Bacteroidales bacterium]|jgi:hypothetical protein|nr:hypothetical protein [Bacteroidales bacterium]
MDNIKKDFKRLRKDMRRYYAPLNKYGIWLFIVSVGCWGISHPVVQLIANILTGFIFLYYWTMFLPISKAGKSYPKRLRELKAKHGAEACADEIRNIRKIYWEAKIFFVCSLFYVYSFYAIVISYPL